MARKSKEVKIEPSVFRVMVENIPWKWVTTDFSSKEEALQYAHDLSSDKVAQYIVYELSPKVEHLIYVEHKRLVPYDDRIVVTPKEDSKPVKKRQRKK